MKTKVLNWFVSGETGISSETMAAAVCDIKPNKKWSGFGNHPSDPDDFKRCVKFLEAVPEARNHLNKVAALSKQWEKLITNWDELEMLFHEEFTSGKGTNLFARMKELGC